MSELFIERQNCSQNFQDFVKDFRKNFVEKSEKVYYTVATKFNGGRQEVPQQDVGRLFTEEYQITFQEETQNGSSRRVIAQ